MTTKLMNIYQVSSNYSLWTGYLQIKSWLTYKLTPFFVYVYTFCFVFILLSVFFILVCFDFSFSLEREKEDEVG